MAFDGTNVWVTNTSSNTVTKLQPGESLESVGCAATNSGKSSKSLRLNRYADRQLDPSARKEKYIE
jgi:hypothetical protein